MSGFLRKFINDDDFKAGYVILRVHLLGIKHLISELLLFDDLVSTKQLPRRLLT